MKRSLKIAAILLFLIGLYLAYDSYTGDFRQINLSFDRPYDPELEVAPLSQEEKQLIDQLLDQPFRWLNQGHQVYAFQTADQKYVLKIFKFKRLKPSSFTPWLIQLPWVGDHFQKAEDRRIHRIEKLFRGYHLAYSSDKEHTGLLFIHLNKNRSLNKTVHLKDRLGLTHQLDLDQLYFAIQRRARTTKEVLVELLDKGDLQEARQRIFALLDMYIQEYEKGIVDWDHNIMHNTGFIGLQPVRLDIGQLQYDERVKDPKVYLKDLKKITSKRFTGWLKKHYPSSEPTITADIENKLLGVGP